VPPSPPFASSRTRRAAGWLALAAGLAMGLGACAPKEERYAEHLRAAREYRAEGRTADAIIELKNAMGLDPQAGAAYSELAEIELAEGDLEQALFYYQEAQRLAPDDIEATINLAVLLRSEQPKRASDLVEGVIARHPQSPVGYVGRAEIALARGQRQRAIAAAHEAVEVAPDDPRGHWEVGYVYSAVLSAGAVEPDKRPAFYRKAVKAFRSYLELGGERPAAAHLELARLYEEWTGHETQMLDSFREAVRLAEEANDLALQRRAARLAERAGRRMGHRALRVMALQRLVELDPDDTEAWALLTRLQTSAPAVVHEQVREASDDPEERLQEAREILRESGYEAAVAFLEASARAGVDPPAMLAAAINLHHLAGRPGRAREVLRRLQVRHPDHPRTRLETAQLAIRTGAREEGLEQLYVSVEESESIDAWRLIAETELSLGHLAEAAGASDRALELTEGFSVRDQRLRARILHEADAWGPARRLFALLDERAGLSPGEHVMWIRARHYDGEERQARQKLVELLHSPDAPPQAAVLFAELEWGRRGREPAIRRELERGHRRHPGSPRLLELLTDLDLRAGRVRAASARLEAVSSERNPPGLRMLRARTAAARGDHEAARAHARAAFEVIPNRPEALELLAAVLTGAGARDAEIARLRALEEPGPADLALLGRLLAAAGERDAAIGVFERALSAGDPLPSLQLAFAALLHDAGRETERALALAEDAARALGPHPRIQELQGALLLEAGRHEEALRHLELARRSARLPGPEVFYLSGLALRELGEGERATRSIESALSIDPDFAHRDDARRQLQELRAGGQPSPS